MVEVNKVLSLAHRDQPVYATYGNLHLGQGFTIDTDNQLRIRTEEGHSYGAMLHLRSLKWSNDLKVILVDVRVDWCARKENQ